MSIPTQLKKSIPNILSLSNLFCGCVGISKIFEGDFSAMIYLLSIALVLDFMDGTTARILNAKSELGKQLDALADVVTFGVLPGVSLFYMMSQSEIICFPWAYSGFLVPVFSALRLAIFNTGDPQNENFIGLPTPANAVLICTTLFTLSEESTPLTVWLSPESRAMLFITLSVLCSLLLVSPIHLLSLKVSSLHWKKNKLRYTFLLVSIILLIYLKIAAAPLIIIIYILLSIFFLEKKTQKVPRDKFNM